MTGLLVLGACSNGAQRGPTSFIAAQVRVERPLVVKQAFNCYATPAEGGASRVVVEDGEIVSEPPTQGQVRVTLSITADAGEQTEVQSLPFFKDTSLVRFDLTSPVLGKLRSCELLLEAPSGEIVGPTGSDPDTQITPPPGFTPDSLPS